MRLNKYLALCGVGSRRTCDQLIEEGLVQVNGETGVLGTIVEPGKDKVMFQNNLVVLDIKKYYLFYKPLGVLTTIVDPYGRPCLGDYLKKLEVRLFSIGRLDADSEGLLFLTNDGDFAHKIQHPKYKMEKKYRVWVDKILTNPQKKRFITGIQLEEGITAPADIVKIKDLEYEVTLKQGWHRQIRRMLASLDIKVTRLKRIAIASYELGDLKVGELREIELNHKKNKK